MFNTNNLLAEVFIGRDSHEHYHSKFSKHFRIWFWGICKNKAYSLDWNNQYHLKSDEMKKWHQRYWWSSVEKLSGCLCGWPFWQVRRVNRSKPLLSVWGNQKCEKVYRRRTRLGHCFIIIPTSFNLTKIEPSDLRKHWFQVSNQTQILIHIMHNIYLMQS